MNVPAHLILGTAVFGKASNARITLAAVLGSLAPDLSLFAMAGWSLFVAGVDPAIVFGEYYFSDAWQRVFSIDNSFIFWGLGLLAAVWADHKVMVAFAAAGLMHLGFDFLLHNSDARIQFWPLSDWAFISPVSYWDVRYYANIVSPIELGVTLILAVVLLRRFKSSLSRVFILLAAIAEISTSHVFGMFFSH